MYECYVAKETMCVYCLVERESDSNKRRRKYKLYDRKLGIGQCKTKTADCGLQTADQG